MANEDRMDGTGQGIPEEANDEFYDAVEDQAAKKTEDTAQIIRQKLQRAGTSYASIPPPGHLLTGKQEHYLKRELLSHQTEWEISELSSPTALQRFGAPFRSSAGEVRPEDSELPILRFIFNNHVRNFPFLDKAKEKEFWQDKLQVFLESFANKRISTSEDRLEETKRKKLATKAEKLVELMMVSGIPTASGYEERIRFAEIDPVDRSANEKGLVANAPQGHDIHGWDVNVAGVRTTSIKRHVRYHQHAEYIIRVKQASKPEHYVGRRYEDFKRMHKRLRLELPGKILPPLPKKNYSDQSFSLYADDSNSESSVSTQDTGAVDTHENSSPGGLRSYIPGLLSTGNSSNNSNGHKRNLSTASAQSMKDRGRSPRASVDASRPVTLYREGQRVSLRAALRNLLQNEMVAQSAAMNEFLLQDPIKLNEEETTDIERRKEMDERRIEEQRQFYEIARKRAAELDVHMEKFRRDIVERNGLTKLFQEIRVKNSIAELSPEYKKFAEWVRIEVAATIYHLFLAEDNSPELFAQGKRIHSLVPYTVLKNIVRFTNPAAVMAQVLDLFMAQPFGTRSLLQRIFGMAIHDGINNIQKSIDILMSQKIKEPALCDKIKGYVSADEETKIMLKQEAQAKGEDLVITIMQSDRIAPELNPKQVEAVFNAYVAWNNVIENVDAKMRDSAELFAHLKQLFKLYLRQRDKAMMLEIIEEPTTLRLFRDLFQIFYEPLVRVYKSANVYNSITDFAYFVDDTIRVIEAAQRQDISADPNQTVQAFIDLCARHEHNLYKFIHEVHNHDNGLFSSLMEWIEGILAFLRQGPKGGKLDMNALFKSGLDSGLIDGRTALREINSLVKWQMARKRWHQDKTRQKMAAEGAGEGAGETLPGFGAFRSSDFGINENDLAELDLNASATDSDDSDDELDEFELGEDPIVVERRRRTRERERLRRTAGEPKKPDIVELNKLMPGFLGMLRQVLAA